MATDTVEEVVGVIQGLAAGVKEQLATNRDLSAQTQYQIVDLASFVKELSTIAHYIIWGSKVSKSVLFELKLLAFPP